MNGSCISFRKCPIPSSNLANRQSDEKNGNILSLVVFWRWTSFSECFSFRINPSCRKRRDDDFSEAFGGFNFEIWRKLARCLLQDFLRLWFFSGYTNCGWFIGYFGPDWCFGFVRVQRSEQMDLGKARCLYLNCHELFPVNLIVTQCLC